MHIRVNFTYVTSQLDGIDVMTRHHHARQHTWVRCRHTHTARRTSAAQDHPVYIKIISNTIRVAQYLLYQTHFHYKNLKCNASYIHIVASEQ